MQWLTRGATHTFMSTKLVKQYGLLVSKCPSYIKSVNAKAQAIVGMVYNVPITVGNWVGKVNMMIIQLEDFQLILGIKDPMPHLDGVMVMQESNPCFVHCLHPYGKGQNKHKINNISAVAFEKGLKHGETSHLAALIEIEPDKMVEMPDCIVNGSSEFARHETILLQLLDSEWTVEIHTDTRTR